MLVGGDAAIPYGGSGSGPAGGTVVTTSRSAKEFVEPPDPDAARTLDELAEHLRRLKVWAGDPSYDVITDRVNAAWTAAGRPSGELAQRGTVVDCFRTSRQPLRRVRPDM